MLYKLFYKSLILLAKKAFDNKARVWYIQKVMSEGKFMTEAVYLYVRHTPKMVRIFASREVKPHGVSKKLLPASHPLGEVAALHARGMLAAMKSEVLRTKKRPTLQLMHTLAMQAFTAAGIEYAYIPRCATYPERIRLTRGQS
jgi:hypothetical protein